MPRIGIRESVRIGIIQSPYITPNLEVIKDHVLVNPK